MAFRPILARLNRDVLGGMMTGLRTGTLGKTIDLDREGVGRPLVGGLDHQT
jgi:hypothetical protein